MRVAITRPASEATAWVEGLRAQGLDAQALPLIAISGLPDLSAVHGAWHGLERYRAAMFVSANAVTHFFAARPAGRDWPAGTRAWAPGPGTAAALRTAGLAAPAIDTPDPQAAQFDSEALWQAAGAGIRPGDTVLIVRGEDSGADTTPGTAGTPGHGRDWMARRLAEAGAAVDFVVAYRRGVPAWDAAQLVQATTLAAADTAWVFSNSEAIGHLLRLLPAPQAALAGTAVATHPRIAAAARQAGFTRVVEAAPTLDALARALHGLAPGTTA